MSFVTTPISSSSPSARQSAATSELFPEPTGPPIPIRSGPSGGKEPPLAAGVGQGAQLERGREAGGEQTNVLRLLRRLAGEALEERSGVDQPARGQRRVDWEEPDGGGGDGGRVLVQVRLRELPVVEAGGRRHDTEGDGPRGGRALPPVARERLIGGPDDRGAAQQLRAEPRRRGAKRRARATGERLGVEPHERLEVARARRTRSGDREPALRRRDTPEPAREVER